MSIVLSRYWDKLRRDEVRTLQIEKLRTYLRRVVLPFSVYYRDLFARENLKPENIHCMEDLQKIPFTSKEDLLNTPEKPSKAREFVLIPDEKVLSRRPSTLLGALLHGKKGIKDRLAREYRPLLLTSTTGRSADPVPFLYTQHDLDNLRLTGVRLMEICDSSTDYRHINMFPYAPHLAFWQAHYAGTGFNTFSVSSGGGKAMGTDGNVRLLKKIQPDALIGMPTFLYHVLHQASEQGVASPNLKRIVLGGEKVPNGMRRKLRELAAELGSGRVEVLSTYAFTEAKMAWPECPFPFSEEPSGFHLYPDLSIMEIVDPDTGEQLPDGEGGEIVHTALDARGSMVLRYRTGDYIDGGLTYEPCPHCGRQVPRLLGKISRVSNVREMQLDKIKGTLVDFNELEHILDDADNIGAWQIELRKHKDDPLDVDEMLLHVHATGNKDQETLRRELEARFLSYAEIRPNKILFHDAEDLRRRQGVGKELKEEKILDNRPAAQPNAPRAHDANPVTEFAGHE